MLASSSLHCSSEQKISFLLTLRFIKGLGGTYTLCHPHSGGIYDLPMIRDSDNGIAIPFYAIA